MRSSLQFTKKTGIRYSLFAFLITDAAWSYLRAFSRLSNVLAGMNTRRVMGHDRDIAWVQSLQPDYIVSCYFNQIISMKLARIAKIGCVNSHASLLPAHRGPDPVFWTIEKGDETAGVAVHVIDETIDTGPILVQKTINVLSEPSVFSASWRIHQESAWCAVEFVARGESCDKAAQQSDHQASHEPWPSPVPVNALRARGKPLIGLGEYFRVLRKTATDLDKRL